MAGVRRFVSAHRYYFCILAFILLYNYVVVGKCAAWHTDLAAYEFHALDFSMGFGSFILPGQIYQWICGAPNTQSLERYQTVPLLVFFVVLAAFLERLLLCVEKKDRLPAAMLILLFLTGPFTFSIFVTDLGVLEVYWIYLAAVFFFCLAYRPLNLLIAPLCVLALAVNYAAMICYVPFFCILLLYKYVTETSKSEKRMLLASFIVCILVSFPVFFYLVLNTQKNMVYSMDEFNHILRLRGVKELSYVDLVLYGRDTTDFPAEFYEVLEKSAFYTPGDNLTLIQRLFNFVEVRSTYLLFSLWYRNPLRVVVPFLSIVPVVGLIFRFCGSELRNKQNPRLRRFVFFCMPTLFVLILFVTTFVSHDTIKWIDYSYLPLLTSFLYVFYREPERTAAFIRRALRAFNPTQIGMYVSVYAFFVLWAYY